MARVNLGLGECKRTLETGVGKLRRAITETEGLSIQQKIMYEKAIIHMKVARVLLGKIPCLQPSMSFDIGPYRRLRKRARKGRKGRGKP
jgi:hypothetical protein